MRGIKGREQNRKFPQNHASFSDTINPKRIRIKVIIKIIIRNKGNQNPAELIRNRKNEILRGSTEEAQDQTFGIRVGRIPTRHRASFSSKIKVLYSGDTSSEAGLTQSLLRPESCGSFLMRFSRFDIFQN